MPATQPELAVRALRPADRDAALRHLARDARANLFLLDLCDRIGAPPSPGESPTRVLAAFRGGEIAGVACLRPSVVFDVGIGADALAALLPHLDELDVGLVKSDVAAVDAFWERLAAGRRRRALVDRTETAYAVTPRELSPEAGPAGLRVRPARDGDLEDLVVAARESLREEHRPDPFAGDPKGFRRWVRGRLPRARVAELGGRIVFVGYADVRRPQGWLLQGIYTWPALRRRGIAAAGVTALCREAFAGSADHVQLAVVDGNLPGRKLYERLNFQPFLELRTILFA